MTYSYANDKALDVDIVIKSTRLNYPDIINALDEIKSAKGKAQNALGEFDLRLKSKVDSRVEGYYDGDYFDAFLEKPLQYLNSKVYAGVRKSEQDFPVYEGKMKTLDQGESLVGLELSLLRNRNIDEKRLKLRNNRLKVKEQEQDYYNLEMKILKNATKTYWNWVTKGLIYNVNLKLMKVLERQGEAITENIQNGAMAKIYKVENLQYLMKQKTEVLKAKQEFKEASLALSLFLRDSKGKPMVVNEDYLPKDIEVDSKVNPDDFLTHYKDIIKINPYLRMLDLKKLQLNNEEMLAENELSPKLDLKFEVSKDNGNGLESLQGEEQRVFLQIEIPIERNLGRGSIQRISAKKRIVDQSIKFQKEQLSIKLKTIVTRIKTNRQIIKNTNQELEFAKKLQVAETERFIQGTSDFFVVNMRDRNVASAEIKLAKTKYKLSKDIAEYKALTMSF